MAGDCGYRACSPGEDHATHTAEVAGLPYSLATASRVLPARVKTRSPRAERAGRGGRAKRGYVHTVGTSSKAFASKVFTGTTEDGLVLLKRQRKARAVYDLYHSLRALGDHERAGKLLNCGRWLWLEWLPACGGYRFRVIYCDDVLCPRCANRRSVPLQRKVLQHIRRGQNKNLPKPDQREYWFLTITVKNTFDFSREFLNKMRDHFAELRASDVWKSEVTGGMYSLEATYSAVYGWHPHYHVLIERRAFDAEGRRNKLPMDWIERLKRKWLEITGDSHVLNLKPVHGKDSRGRYTKRVNMRAVCELVKYATKSADFAATPDLVREFCAAFRNTRRVQSFGSFLGVEQEAKDAEAAAEKKLTADEPAGCPCGKCLKSDFVRKGHVHISETVLLPDGTRQLLLFPMMDGVTEMRPICESPPGAGDAWEPGFTLESAEFQRNEQRRLAWRESLPADFFETFNLRAQQAQFTGLN